MSGTWSEVSLASAPIPVGGSGPDTSRVRDAVWVRKRQARSWRSRPSTRVFSIQTPERSARSSSMRLRSMRE